ncbi:MAG: glycosyltransferase [Acutalibacteraceae bacterium]
MKKILIVHSTMEIGGAETSLLGLLQSLDYTCFEVDLLLFEKKGDFLDEIPKQVHVFELAQYRNLVLPIKQVIKNGNFAVAFSRIIGRIKGKKYIAKSYMTKLISQKLAMPFLPEIEKEYDLAMSFIDPHYVVSQKVKAKVKLGWLHTDFSRVDIDLVLDEKMWQELDYIVNVSESCKQAFDEKHPSLKEKSIVIENILSKPFVEKRADEFEAEEMKKQNGETVLLSVGRFSNQKNFDNVPDICRRITEKGFNIKWYLVGYGGDEALIRQKIAEAGMENRVVILGKKVNPYPYIKACDVYVQPSRYEGKAVTVREAQILNKPVIITDFATSKSQLENGFDGMIVPLENEKCADGIAEIISDKNLLQKLSDNTKERDYTNACEIEKIYAMVKNDED